MFSDKQLQTIIEGNAVGNYFPYDTNNEQEIEAHIRRLFYRLKRIPDVRLEAEWNHFGSGYASFVEIFCYRKEDITVIKEKNGERELEISGIIVDICRLAPVAIMGEDKRFKTIDIATNEELAGGFGSLLDDPRRVKVGKKFQTVERQLHQALEEFEYKNLDEAILKQPLTFKTKIATIYRKPREYKVMDALFYWED
ncbi:hypothetical protein [Oceanobacillus sojae]|uniref:hypothetical protein n=1 Tax=Oceanobacillus sojae TaxID=582851 RepID=UPI0009886096|nr:hypothetical protein [Oceanobacillus sojae]